MNCAEALGSLVDRSLGSLALPRAAELDAHLELCAECARRARGVSTAWRAVEELERSESARPVRPTDIASVVAASRRVREAPEAPIGGGVRRWSLRAAAALLLAAGLVALTRVEVTGASGSWSLSWTLPGSESVAERDARARIDAEARLRGDLRQELREELRIALVGVADALREADARRAADMDALVAWLHEARASDAALYSDSLAHTREDLQLTQHAVLRVAEQLPAWRRDR